MLFRSAITFIVDKSDPQVTDNMNVMAEESACETIETEIVFPEMEHNGAVAHIHQDPNDFQILDMEGIEAEDMNSLFEQFETHDDDITQEAVIEETVISNEEHMKDLLDQSTVRDATQTARFTHDVPMIGQTNPNHQFSSMS
mgnify:CR=1 FL=1